MTGRLKDYLREGSESSLPDPTVMVDLIQNEGLAFYRASDTGKLFVFDRTVPEWVEYTQLSLFSELQDIDWSTPPEDGQLFLWDATAMKLVPRDIPSGFPEAPEDGTPYSRQDASWVPSPQSEVEEAPIDGNQYARKDGTWEEVVAGGGGGRGISFGPSNLVTAGVAGEGSATYGNVIQNLSDDSIFIDGIVMYIYASATTQTYKFSASAVTPTLSADRSSISAVVLGASYGESQVFKPVTTGAAVQVVKFDSPIEIPANSYAALMITRLDKTPTTAPQLGYVGGSSSDIAPRFLSGPVRCLFQAFRVNSKAPPIAGATTIMLTDQVGWAFYPYGSG